MIPSPSVVSVGLFERAVSDALAKVLRGIDSGQRFGLALSGGGTPVPIYRALAQAEGILWANVFICQTDERAVPEGHPRSNFSMIGASLLAGLRPPPPEVLRMRAEADDLSEAASQYSRALPQQLHLAALGIGEDGHVLSVFPGDRDAWTDSARVLARRPRGLEARLTLSPRYVEQAREVVVFAKGRDKASAVRRALDPATVSVDCPASAFRTRTWILDEDAASLL